jgi:hypothetical protein
MTYEIINKREHRKISGNQVRISSNNITLGRELIKLFNKGTLDDGKYGSALFYYDAENRLLGIKPTDDKSKGYALNSTRSFQIPALIARYELPFEMFQGIIKDGMIEINLNNAF